MDTSEYLDKQFSPFPQETNEPLWRGVAISAPYQIIFNNAIPAVPLQFPVVVRNSFVSGSADLQQIHHTVFVMRDITNDKEYRCQEFQQFDGVQAIPYSELDGVPAIIALKKELDISDYMPIPRVAATYDVHVEVGKAKSNTCRVEVIIEEK